MAENPLASVEPWDLVSDGYVDEVMPVFEKWALDSIRRVEPRRSDRVLDMATGPGTVALLLAPLVAEVVALDFSARMIRNLESIARKKGVRNIETEVCDCQRLPCCDASFDLAFSQFGLMFFPDRKAGFREMYRVLKPGGKAAVYSWAPISESTAMQAMMNALVAGFPEAAPKKRETKTIVHGLDNLEVFREELAETGFRQISFESITHAFPVLPPEKFWHHMVKGSAPISLMKASVDGETWKRNERKSIQYLEENMGDTALTSTAYLAIAFK